MRTEWQARWSGDWPAGFQKQLPSFRRHPAILIGPVFLTLFSLLAAGLLLTSIARDNGLGDLLILLAWFALILRLAWKFLDWRIGYFFATGDRIIVVSGVFRQKVTAIWLAQVTAIEVKRGFGGRILGYGELVFHSQCPALLALDYVPYPEQLKMELNDLTFPGTWHDFGD
jgi:hypothetical protein